MDLTAGKSIWAYEFMCVMAIELHTGLAEVGNLPLTMLPQGSAWLAQDPSFSACLESASKFLTRMTR